MGEKGREHSEQPQIDMKKILLIGDGGHCRSCIEVLNNCPEYEPWGVISAEPLVGDLLGVPIVGSDRDLENLLKETEWCLITLGQIFTASARIRLFEAAKALGAKFPSIISTSCVCSSFAQVGEGSILMHGTVVNANASIGKNCVINTRSVIEHDAMVGDHCHISVGAILNGAVRVGDECFIGSGAILREGITVERGAVIGAGVRVMRDVQSNVVLK